MSQREAVENKVERQCQVGALRRLSREEIEGRDWCFPAFGISKKNDKICFVSINFKSINNQLEQQEYPLTLAEEIFHSIGGFTWATSLDLNMGYLHIRLSQASQELLIIVMPIGFYSCTVLPMGVMPATDIFQSRMVSIFADMGPEKPIPYINDIIHSKGATFKLHLDILDKIFQHLGKAGMQVDTDKSKFFRQALKFLGFTLTPTGYHPLKKRVEAIMQNLPPKNVKNVRHFSGVIKFIKNHINGRAGIMQPITKLTKKGKPCVWGVKQQEAFDKINAVISEAILLTYLDPSKRFHIFPVASSKHAMGAVLVQEDKPVSIYSTFSRKFDEAQLKYTVTEQELLTILESCKHFKNIIHGCNVTVHTDHKNLTYSPTQRMNARV